MVVFSLLVIVISGGLLAVGIVSGDDMLVIGSIVLSLVAAIVLFIGVWRQRDPDVESSVAESLEAQSPEAKWADDEASMAGSVPVSENTVRGNTMSGRWDAPSEHPVSPPGRLSSRVSDDNASASTDAAERQHRRGSTPVSKADHAAWARSAVASITDTTAADDAGAIMHDRRTSSVDVATEIPQLMSASSAPKSVPQTDPPPATSQIDVQAGPTQVTGEPAEVSQQSDPTAQQRPPEAATEVGLSRPSVAESMVSAVDVAAQPQDPVGRAIPGLAGTEDHVAHGAEPSAASGTELPPTQTATQAIGGDNAATDNSDAVDAYSDPPDEPPAELLLSYEERQLSDCTTEVLVVDGRPRFHLEGCPHLADKAGEPLVLSEAAELGFTSCSLCAAATTVLAARR